MGSMKAALALLGHVKAPPADPSPQESQHDVAVLGHALPPFGALHLSALGLTRHFALPFLSIRQQATAPGLPHVERAAHFTTWPLHAPGNVPLVAMSLTAFATHFTY